MVNKFKVITLCGSTRFKDAFLRVQKQLTLEGNIVISVGMFGHSGDEEVWKPGIKDMLDRMHLSKIDMSDEIFVINVDGYIGESTSREIAYAHAHGKKVNYLEQPSSNQSNNDIKMEAMTYWFLTCDTNRYDIDTLFKENGYCLWNQRRNFKVGDVVYIYESKPISKVVYKTIVEEINVIRDTPENSEGFYKRDYNKDFAVKLRFEAINNGNRLQLSELKESFGFSNMSMLRIPQITRKEIIEFFEDVFAGKVEDLPAPPTLEDLYQPLESGSILEHIKHKMEFFKIRDTHLAKQVGVGGSAIGRVRKGEAIKSEYILRILDVLGFGFTDGSILYNAPDITEIIQQRIISSGIRTTELAALSDASPSVISHLKNDGDTPKLEILEKLINHYGYKVVLKK